MKINLVAIGKRLPAAYEQLIADYQKRLSTSWDIQWLTTASQSSKTYSSEQQKQIDCKHLAALLPAGGLRIALSEHGQHWDNQALAQQFHHWQQQHACLHFIIGGAHGFSDDFLASCDLKWSLSRLTFPHQMVRLIVIEQLYRVWTMHHGHPYHK